MNDGPKRPAADKNPTPAHAPLEAQLSIQADPDGVVRGLIDYVELGHLLAREVAIKGSVLDRSLQCIVAAQFDGSAEHAALLLQGVPGEIRDLVDALRLLEALDKRWTNSLSWLSPR